MRTTPTPGNSIPRSTTTPVTLQTTLQLMITLDIAQTTISLTHGIRQSHGKYNYPLRTTPYITDTPENYLQATPPAALVARTCVRCRSDSPTPPIAGLLLNPYEVRDCIYYIYSSLTTILSPKHINIGTATSHLGRVRTAQENWYQYHHRQLDMLVICYIVINSLH